MYLLLMYYYIDVILIIVLVVVAVLVAVLVVVGLLVVVVVRIIIFVVSRSIQNSSRSRSLTLYILFMLFNIHRNGRCCRRDSDSQSFLRAPSWRGGRRAGRRAT